MTTRWSSILTLSAIVIVAAHIIPSGAARTYGSLAIAAESSLVEGTISVTEVDGTVAIASKDGRAVVVYVRDTTEIFRDGKPAKLKDLKKGDRVKAEYAPDRGLIKIQATHPADSQKASEIKRVITVKEKEMDGTLVVRPEGDAPRVVVYVRDDTKIFLNGNSAGLEHLDKGEWMHGTYGTDRSLKGLRVFTYEPGKI